MRPGCKRVGFAALLLLGVVSPAGADMIPNPDPGAPTLDSSSTSAVITYDNIAVDQRADIFSTTLLTTLDGVLLSSQDFAAAFSDPAVQGAVTGADAILTGDGATFEAPITDLSMTSLFSSVAATPATYTCQTVAGAPGASVTHIGSTTTTNFGPETIAVDACQSDTLFVEAGQVDFLTNIETDYLVTQDVLTTDTYLTNAIYEIDGTTAAVTPPPVSMPEPGTLALFVAGVSGLTLMRRRGPGLPWGRRV